MTTSMNTINSIVFSGGGMKGITFLGVIKKLEEQKKLEKIRYYYGTSIGALFCMCISIGFTFQELYSFFETNIKELTPSYSVTNLISFFGADNGLKLQILISRLLNFKAISIKTTFLDLYSKFEKELNVFATDLKFHNLIQFNYLLTPESLVLDAIKSSMSLPIVFKPVLNRYIDGALLCNFPIKFSENSKDTFCFNISSDINEMETLFGYISNIFSCVVNFQNNSDNCNRSKFLLHVNLNPLNFNISQETIQETINIGYKIL